MLKKSKSLIGLGCIVVLIAVNMVALSASSENISHSEDDLSGFVFSNNDEIITSIRQGLRAYSRCITVTFEYGQNILSQLSSLVDSWIEEALQETGLPTEGDYIRYQYGGYERTCSYTDSKGRYYYTIEIVPKYYMYLVQEEEVCEKVEEIINDFGFDESASDYEKIQTIYAYVCEYVSYDEVHEKNPYYFLRSTSYAALIQGTATCQGYCVALYRMLRKMGIDTRIVTGSTYGEDCERLHAWNIVELDGKYYCLDATWDSGKDDYRYFLKGADFFLDHTVGEEFSTAAFKEQYPISDKDYAIMNRVQ